MPPYPIRFTIRRRPDVPHGMRMMGSAAVIVIVAAIRVVAAAEAVTTPLAERLIAEDRAALVAEIQHAGDPRAGATIFHTRHLTCTQCHVVGEGPALLGPSLAALPPDVPRERVVAHLIDSLLDPSASIRPEYRGVTLLTVDGRSVSGLVVRETDEAVVLREAATAGGEITVRKDDIDERLAATTSLMPGGLVNLLADRKQFIDLVRFLADVAEGGPSRAAALAPDAALLAAPAAYEAEIDHAGFLAEWADAAKSQAALERGAAIYARVCANCHGTLDAAGSLPTAPRFAQSSFKAGSDPHALYRTLTNGVGLMVAQGWMVPSQKYDVIHYLRETFLKDHNAAWYTPVTPDYLASLPKGTIRGPEPATIEPWRMHDYGPFLAGSFEVGTTGANVARKGLAVRLDPGVGGVGRGRAWILYELDTLRAAAFWTGGGFLDWAGINFDGRHGTHPRVSGTVQAEVQTMPGWAEPASGSFDDLRPSGRDGQPYGPLPREHARFRAVHHAAAGGHPAEPRSAVILEFTVGDTRVLETASLAPPLEAPTTSTPVLVRAFSLGPRRQDLAVRLAAAPASAVIVGEPHADATSPRIERRADHVDLLVPAGQEPLDVAVAVSAAESTALERHASALTITMPGSLIGVPAPRLWASAIETSIVAGPDTGPFATDVLTPPEPNPWNAQTRFSGIDFTGVDAAVLCTWDGDVWEVRGLTAPRGTMSWRRIASGLYQPLGIKVIDGVVHVGCRDRIVRLVDLDADGMTDRYDTFNDDHQVTEHFHEFAMGLETDAEGNVYYAKSARHGLPAVVPHHGTLLKVSPDGSATEIVATGFRAANGVCVEADGTFWVTDQEGFWCPKNRINLVRPGGFYGNMFGYHDVTDSSDDAMEQPAFWITNAFDRSPAELLRVTSPRWTPLGGHLLELSYGEGRIHLVLTEAAAGSSGTVQGGMVALPMPDLPTGVMRGRFHPGDGQLYACGLYAWAGNRTQSGGCFRVRRTKRPLTIPVGLHAAAGTIMLSFPEPLDPASVASKAAWRVKTWGLERTRKYGSRHVDETSREVAAATLSPDGRRVSLDVPDFAATWCYSVEWTIASADGTPVRGVLHGTLH